MMDEETHATLDRIAQQAHRMSLDAMLEERNGVHGDFHQDARISQALKHVVRDGANWDDLSNVQKEALDHICTKMGRILSGDHEYADHWCDICGYATLVMRALR